MSVQGAAGQQPREGKRDGVDPEAPGDRRRGRGGGPRRGRLRRRAGRRGHLPAVPLEARRQVGAPLQGEPRSRQPQPGPAAGLLRWLAQPALRPGLRPSAHGPERRQHRPQLRPSRGRLGVPQLVLQALARGEDPLGLGDAERYAARPRPGPGATAGRAFLRVLPRRPAGAAAPAAPRLGRRDASKLRVPAQPLLLAGPPVVEPVRRAVRRRLHAARGSGRVHRAHAPHAHVVRAGHAGAGRTSRRPSRCSTSTRRRRSSCSCPSIRACSAS